MATSPTSTTPTATSPTFLLNETAQNRIKFKPKPNTVLESDDDDGGGGDGCSVGCGTNVKCDSDGSNNDVVRNISQPEIEISSLPCNEGDNIGSISIDVAPPAITMNTLLSPINQIHVETYSNSGADNDSDGN